MHLSPVLMESVYISISALQPRDLPAVVIFDNHNSMILAEPATRFAGRDDFATGRYRMLLHVSQDLYDLSCEYVDGMEGPSESKVIDISTKHFEPPQLMRLQ